MSARQLAQGGDHRWLTGTLDCPSELSRSFDCGSKIGFLTANVAYALERKDIAPEFREELRRMLGNK
jgi:UTP-glucose-1-phosphate uridylyltransferase